MLTSKEVAERLVITERTVLNFIKKGTLKAYRIGGLYRIDETDLNEFINQSKLNDEKEK